MECPGASGNPIGPDTSDGLGTTAKPIMWLDNRALKFDQPVLADHRRFSNLASGGFFSYDNMHLTTAGYGLLAVTLLGAIRQNEPDAVKNEEYYWQAMGLIHPATNVAQDLWQSETILRMGTRRDDLDRESIFILLPTVAQH